MKERYGFWIYILGLTLLVLIISALFIPAGDKLLWSSPLTLGWLDLSFYEPWYKVVSVCLGFIFSALIVISTYSLYIRVANYTFNFKYTAIFLLLFIYSNPASIYFNPLFVAALALLWAQISYISSKKFLSMFLVSLATICYAPLIWTIPFIFILSVLQSQNVIKNFIIILSGLLTPFIYLLTLRFILFSDLSFFLDEFFKQAININTNFYSINFTVLFQLICIVIISLIAVIRILMKFNRLKVFYRDILKMEIVTLALSATIFFIFSEINSFPLVILLAPSWAFIYSFYLLNIELPKRTSVEIILIISAFAIARMSYFILPG